MHQHFLKYRDFDYSFLFHLDHLAQLNPNKLLSIFLKYFLLNLLLVYKNNPCHIQYNIKYFN